MYKIALILLCLVYTGNGEPRQSQANNQGRSWQTPLHMQRSSERTQNLSKSLATLLLTFKPAAAFDPSGFRLGSFTGANLRQVDLQRRRCVGQCSALVGKEVVAEENIRLITKAVKKVDREAERLDVEASQIPQLANSEIALLGSTVGVSFLSPLLLSGKVTEVVVPSMGAIIAAVGFSAEYIGKAAVARGKEFAAISLEAAARSESFLAKAERTKAIIPLCVGLSATAAAFGLVAPVFVKTLALQGMLATLKTPILLFSPAIALLGALVAALATKETVGLADRAVGIATKPWNSEQEGTGLPKRKSKLHFALGIWPAIASGILSPVSFSHKAIVTGAVAAAQAAYSFIVAEYAVTQAAKSVAVKSRSAAVADAYANQGARAGSILPFTSSLSAFCAAVTVAIVEFLPFLNSAVLESLGATIFPATGAVIAAAASISKARCEVDAEAATQCANVLAEPEPEVRVDPVGSTKELIGFTIGNARQQIARFVPR